MIINFIKANTAIRNGFRTIPLAVSAILGPFALLRFSLAMAGPMFAPVIAGALGAAKAFAAWGVAMLANPITWIVLGIVAAVALLASGAYLLFKNWGRVTAFFGRLCDGVSQAVAGGVARVTGFLMKWSPLGPIVRNWSAVADFFGALWAAAAETVGLGLDLLKLAILRFTPLGFILRNWQPITGFMSGLWTGLQDLVGRGFDVLRALFFNFTPLGLLIRNWSGITGYVGSVWSGARSAVSAGIGAIKSAIANFAPLNDFKAAFAQVWTWMKELPARLMSAGADAMRGFSRGIRGQREQVQAAAAEAAGRAETGARRRLDTHSPSRVFAAIGGDVMDGFALGVKRGSASVVGRMRTTAAAVAAAGAVTVAAPIHAAPLNPPAGVRSTAQEPPASIRYDSPPSALSPAGLPEIQLRPARTVHAPAVETAAPSPVFNLPAPQLQAAPALDYVALARSVAAAAPAITVPAPAVDIAAPSPVFNLPAPQLQLTPALDYAALARSAAAATPAITVPAPAVDIAAPSPVFSLPAPQLQPAPALDYAALARSAAAAALAITVPAPAVDIAAPATVLGSPAFDYAALAAALQETARSPIFIDQAAPLDESRKLDQRLDLSAILRTAEAALVQAAGNSETVSGDRPQPELTRPRDFAPAPQTYQPPAPRPGRPSIGSVTLNIYAQPGQDPREIADEVMRLLQDPNNAAFEDDGEGFD